MAYIGTSPSNGVRRVHTYTATASQTTFTGASSEGITLSYVDANYLDVFQNGVLLGSADYTSTSGTSVVLAQGASADDLIVIVVYDVFSVADTVSKTNGGTFDGGVTVSSTLSAKGGAVFNEDSADVDFRVESNGNTHMLFVDGGNEGVGIGTSSVDTNATMTVSNTADNHALSIVGALNKSRMHFQGANTGSSSTDGLVIGLSSSDDTNDDSALIALKENGSMTFQTNNANRMRIDANGRMQIHSDGQSTFTSDASLEVRGQQNPLVFFNHTQNADEVNLRMRHDFARSGQTCTMIQFRNNGNSEVGTIKVSNTATSYNTSSDYRLKESVNYDFDATTRLKQLKPCRFNFITDKDETVDGFLAHEVSHDADGNALVPEAVSGDKDAVDDEGNIKPQGIDHSRLVPLLTKTLQEAITKIEALETENATQATQIADLISRVTALENAE